MNTTENKVTPVSTTNQDNSKVGPNRRDFLKTFAGLSALVFADPKTFIPAVYQAETQPNTEMDRATEEFRSALRQFFSELQTLEVNYLEHDPVPALKAYTFWLQRIQPYWVNLMQSISIDQSSLQKTVREYRLSYVQGEASVNTYLDSSKIIRTILMLLSQHHPDLLAAEFLHAHQRPLSLDAGTSATLNEGMSTAWHFNHINEWNGLVDVNQAPRMPIMSETNPNVVNPNPTSREFSGYLTARATELLTTITEGSRYLPAFYAETNLGKHDVFHPDTAILGVNMHDGPLRGDFYQLTIERQAALIARIAIKHVLSLADTLHLAGLATHGKDHELQKFTPRVRDAYAELRAKNLILSPSVWSQVKQEYSRLTIAGSRLNSVFAIRVPENNTASELYLETYATNTESDQNVTGYDAFGDQEQFSTAVYFSILSGGDRRWYTKELVNQPFFAGVTRTFMHRLSVPERLLIQVGASVQWVELSQVDCVIEVKQSKLKGIPFDKTRLFERKAGTVRALELVDVGEEADLSDSSMQATEVSAPPDVKFEANVPALNR